MNKRLSPDDMLAGSRPGTRLMPQGFFVRGMAFSLDAFVATGFAACVIRVSGLSSARLSELSPARLGQYGLVALIIYLVIAEGLFGTSLGKRMFGLRVVRLRDGRPCGIWAALLRNALRLIDNVLFSIPGLVAIILSPRSQRLGDRLANTVVVCEVPETILRAMDAGVAGMIRPGVAPAEADGSSGGLVAAPPACVPCPACETQVAPDEVVCPYCRRYINRVTLQGEADELAPGPQLYAHDRGYRFDALWKLVLAGDAASLQRVREAVPGWSVADRRLAVVAFEDSGDAHALPFMDFMIADRDSSVSALACDVGECLRARLESDGDESVADADPDVEDIGAAGL